MPSLSLTKCSTAANGGLGAFNVPGNDVIYSLGLTNSGGNAVDAGSVVLTDTLPAGVIFKYLPYDASTQLPIKVISSGGTNLASGLLAYRCAEETSFTYTPSAGYDPLVEAVKITPTCELAPNATFAVEFRGQVK